MSSDLIWDGVNLYSSISKYLCNFPVYWDSTRGKFYHEASYCKLKFWYGLMIMTAIFGLGSMILAFTGQNSVQPPMITHQAIYIAVVIYGIFCYTTGLIMIIYGRQATINFNRARSYEQMMNKCKPHSQR
jgi:hypothetical protein